MNYRNEARDSLKQAEAELSTNFNSRLKYAALELRMAMEAITYDRAHAFKDEFPPSEYETWQPRKVMSVLLEIEPTADKDCSLAFGLEVEYGKPAPVMESLGSEKVLNMKILKEHYDALGSYLHMPTIKQIQDNKFHDYKKIRARCEEIVKYLKEVLSSAVFNITFGNFSTINCAECDKPIRKRILHEQPKLQAVCFTNKCPASYKIVKLDNGQIEWKPDQLSIGCANKDCKHEIVAWKQEIEIGRCWICPKCKGQNIFSLGIRHDLQRTSMSAPSEKYSQPETASIEKA